MDFPSLRTAGDGLSNIKNSVVNAVRGLRMPGVGSADPVPVAPGAPAPSVPAPSVSAPSTPLPQINPAMADAAPGAAASTAPASMRISANPNVPAGGMSAEAAAAGFGAGGPPKPPGYTPPPPVEPPVGPRGMGMGSLGSAAEMAGKAMAIPGAAIAGYQAYNDAQSGNTAMAGLHGGDALASAALLTPAAPVAGAYLGGRLAGDGVSALLPDSAKDAIGSTINAGLRNVGGIIGQHWGVDDSALKAQTAAAAAPAAPTAAAAATPAVPSDVDAFNKRMADVGAPTVGMRMGADGDGNATRVLGNTAPAGQEAMQAQAINNDARTRMMNGAQADNARMLERQQAAAGLRTMADRTFEDTNQGARLAGQMDQATQARIGAAPVPNAAVIAAQQAQGRQNFEATKHAEMQGTVSMRGQDTTSDDARLQQQTALMNGARAQQNANFEHQLQLTKNVQDQSKIATDQRTAAEKEMTANLGTLFTTKDDKGNTVPDTARVADAASKVQEELAARIKQAEALGQHGIAKELSEKGFAALGPDDKEQMMSQLKIRDRMKQQHAPFTPGGANFVESPLSGYAQAGRESNLIGSDTVRMVNGGSMRAADLKYTEPGNTFLPNGGKIPTTEFNAGLRSKR